MDKLSLFFNCFPGLIIILTNVYCYFRHIGSIYRIEGIVNRYIIFFGVGGGILNQWFTVVKQCLGGCYGGSAPQRSTDQHRHTITYTNYNYIHPTYSACICICSCIHVLTGVHHVVQGTMYDPMYLHGHDYIPIFFI